MELYCEHCQLCECKPRHASSSAAPWGMERYGHGAINVNLIYGTTSTSEQRAKFFQIVAGLGNLTPDQVAVQMTLW